MRYLLQETFSDELLARQKYIYQALKLCTIVTCRSSGFIHLTGIPANCLDILFIVGHNNIVKEYLKTTEVLEKIIVAITCDGSIHFSKLRMPGKALYIPYQNENHYADLINGKLYNFNFDLTESEILFYNLRKSTDLLYRLGASFTKL